MLASGATVVVGVSGGMDSVVLLLALQRLGYKPVVVHVNYGLRGDEADGDEALVKEMCEAEEVPCHTFHLDAKERAKEDGASLQEAARDLRYEAFAHVAQTEQIPVVAVAHHQEDQAETVLLQLLRGTGMEGLVGMRPKRRLQPGSDVMLIRPLLGIDRHTIHAYAKEHRMQWREDASNSDAKYMRNRLRQTVLPIIAEQFGRPAVAHIAETAEVLRGYVEATFEPHLATLWQKATRHRSKGLDIHVLRQQPVVWQQRLLLEALKTWLPEASRNRVFLQRIVTLIDAEPGKHVPCKGGAIWRERKLLIFAAEQHNALFNSLMIERDGEYTVPHGVLHVEHTDVPQQWSKSADIVHVDADMLMYPLNVRYWQAGDRVQPLGMTKTKLVSDLLTDAKVPVHQRKHILVVQSGNDIAWVVGHRIGHCFQITASTKAAVKMVFSLANK